MIRSYPPLLVHASEIFKFQPSAGERSPLINEFHDDLRSNLSGNEEESLSSPEGYFQKTRTSSVEDYDDRPLNLTCKRRKTDNSSPLTTSRPGSNRSSDLSCDSSLRNIENIPEVEVREQLQMLSKEAMERAVLHYRTQVLASNEFVRALMQRRLQEEISSTLVGQLTLPTSGQIVPQWLSAGNLLYKQPLKHVPIYFGQPMENTNDAKKDETDQNMNIRSSVSSPPSTSSSPISSPTLLPGVELKNKSSSAHSPAGFLIAENGRISSSPRLSYPLVLEPANHSTLSNLKQSSQPSITPLSRSTSEYTLSPTTSPENNRKRRRSKRSNNAATNANGESYPCSMCGASYPHKFELNRHVKVSHVRPHRCEECGKGFGHRNYLKVHIETVHMGQKSHQCQLCGKYLSTGGNLNVHVRTIHLGEKKYNCPVCNRSFGQQCNMKTHMKRHYTKSDDMLQ